MKIGKILRRYTPAGQAYSAVRGATGDKGAMRDSLGGGSLGVGGMIGGHMLDQQDARGQAAAAQVRNSREGGTVGKALPGGMAGYYDDSWSRLLQGFQGGGADVGDSLGDLLANFKGKPGDLEDFMQRAGPFLAASQAKKMQGGAAFQHIQNQANWDEGALGAYGPAAAMNARGAAAGARRGVAALNASGLGRSAAAGALQQRSSADAAGQNAGLWAQLQQQAQQNRMRNAGNALDAHRMVAQMALGQVPTPRMMDSGGGGGGGIMGTLGGMAQGAGAGAAIGGPIGGLVGAGLFGAGSLAKK